jgi:Domain of unknown function (DUF4835)
MIKKIIALLIFGGIANISFAQELNMKVTVDYSQLQVNQQRGETQVFEQMQNAMMDFLNGRRWTNDNFNADERIQGNMVITLKQASANGDYTGNATFQVNRPVYGTTYESPLYRFIDRNFNFSYLPTKPINYNDNAYTDNLTSMLAFYAYSALALDYDSFEKTGGNPFIQKIYNIANLAQSGSGDAGWDGRDVRNRYALAENLQNQQMMPFREGFYNYHRLGLDNFLNKPDETRKLILNYLNDVKTVNQLKPSAVLTSGFFDTKSEELINIFAEASRDDRQKAYNFLINLDPTKTEVYKRLLK